MVEVSVVVGIEEVWCDEVECRNSSLKRNKELKKEEKKKGRKGKRERDLRCDVVAGGQYPVHCRTQERSCRPGPCLNGCSTPLAETPPTPCEMAIQ